MWTYRTGAKDLLCQSRPDVSDGSDGCVAPKLYGRIGRELRLCRVKAVRTIAKANQRRSCTDDIEGFAVLKPYGHIGRKLRLSRAKALHKRADRPGGQG